MAIKNNKALLLKLNIFGQSILQNESRGDDHGFRFIK